LTFVCEWVDHSTHTNTRTHIYMHISGILSMNPNMNTLVCWTGFISHQLYVCTYIYIYIYIYIHIYLCTCTYIYIYVYIYMYTYIYIYTYMYVHIRLCGHDSKRGHTGVLNSTDIAACVYTCIYIQVYTCIYMYIYIACVYTCIFTHEYTCIYICTCICVNGPVHV